MHCDELAYLFIWSAYGRMNLSSFDNGDNAMIEYFGQMWTNFAKYGYIYRYLINVQLLNI